ncbi:MAG TPA: MotA/TolQ/ExbB proton channel family protein [Isosphaeraceae bacterium]|nr:MotA/TolQ/ExbB proton channel family protein [Isosphaeraceae bacterium]
MTLGTATALAFAMLLLAAGADGHASMLPRPLKGLAEHAAAWYTRTPPLGRISWGGMAAFAALELGLIVQQLLRLRWRRVVPPEFVNRFLDRLHEGKLDRLKGLDLCEMNPSPAARVAIAAVQRWGRPIGDLERGVALASRIETERLWRNLGSLRRIALISPLLGLLGALASLERLLEVTGSDQSAQVWGPALGAATHPFSAGLALAIVALAAYDGLVVRAEALASALDRLGAATVDGIAMAADPDSRGSMRRTSLKGSLGSSGIHTPHQIRADESKPPRHQEQESDSVRPESRLGLEPEAREPNLR